MKKIILSLVIAASVLIGCKGEKKEQVATESAKVVDVNVADLDNVDTTVSVLTWKGTKPTGAHNGNVSIKKGGLLLSKDSLVGGQFTFDMNSIKNLDMAGTDGAGKIEGHLKAADFFDVAVYPISKFVITNIAKVDGKLAVTGNLQIKDVTKSITIPAMISSVNGITTFTSEMFNINRADFNVKYGSKSFFDNLKDKFIDDLIEMSFVVKTRS
jgi:polyisoprenoid-binding protein YceI